MAAATVALTPPSGFHKREFIAIKALQAERDTTHSAFADIIQPFLPAFASIAQQIPFRHFPHAAVHASAPYQCIGGYAVQLYREYSHIEQPVPLTTDIDCELNTLFLPREDGSYAPVPFYSAHAVINPIYIEYGKFIFSMVLPRFESILPSLAPIDAQLEVPNPAEDDEAKHQDPAFSATRGKYHISLVMNPNYFSKVVIFTKFNGIHEHILEFVLPRFSKPFSEMPSVHPHLGILVATPVALIEKNILGIKGRLDSKFHVEAEYESLLIAPPTPENQAKLAHLHKLIVRVNTKLINHCERVSFLLVYHYLQRILSDRVFDAIEVLIKDTLVRKYETLVADFLLTRFRENPYINALIDLYGARGHPPPLDALHQHTLQLQAMLDSIKEPAPSAAEPAAEPAATPAAAEPTKEVGEGEEEKWLQEILEGMRADEEGWTTITRKTPSPSSVELVSVFTEEQIRKEHVDDFDIGAKQAAETKQEISFEEIAKQQEQARAARAAERKRIRQQKKDAAREEDAAIQAAIDLSKAEAEAAASPATTTTTPSATATLATPAPFKIFLIQEAPSLRFERNTLPLADPEHPDKTLGVNLINRSILSDILDQIESDYEQLHRYGDGKNDTMLAPYIFMNTLPQPSLQFYHYDSLATHRRMLYESRGMYYALRMLTKLKNFVLEFRFDRTAINQPLVYIDSFQRRIQRKETFPSKEFTQLLVDTVLTNLPFAQVRATIKREITDKPGKSHSDKLLVLFSTVVTTYCRVIALLLEYELNKFPITEETFPYLFAKEKKSYGTKYPLTADIIYDMLYTPIKPTLTYPSKKSEVEKYPALFESSFNTMFMSFIKLRASILVRTLQHTVQTMTLTVETTTIVPNVYLFVPYRSVLSATKLGPIFNAMFPHFGFPFSPLPTPNIDEMKDFIPKIHELAITYMKRPDHFPFTLDYNCQQILHFLSTVTKKPLANHRAENEEILEKCNILLANFYDLTCKINLNLPIYTRFNSKQDPDFLEPLRLILQMGAPSDSAEFQIAVIEILKVAIAKISAAAVALMDGIPTPSGSTFPADTLPPYIDTVEYYPNQPLEAIALSPTDLATLRAAQEEDPATAALMAAAKEVAKAGKGGGRRTRSTRRRKSHA